MKFSKEDNYTWDLCIGKEQIKYTKGERESVLTLPAQTDDKITPFIIDSSLTYFVRIDRREERYRDDGDSGQLGGDVGREGANLTWQRAVSSI